MKRNADLKKPIELLIFRVSPNQLACLLVSMNWTHGNKNALLSSKARAKVRGCGSNETPSSGIKNPALLRTGGTTTRRMEEPVIMPPSCLLWTTTVPVLPGNPWTVLRSPHRTTMLMECCHGFSTSGRDLSLLPDRLPDHRHSASSQLFLCGILFSVLPCLIIGTVCPLCQEQIRTYRPMTAYVLIGNVRS